MKSMPPVLPARRRRASAMVTVLLFSSMLIILTGSVIRWSLTERRLNSRGGYWLEARNAAEAVAEHGCYQVAQAFNTRMNPTFTSGGTSPISFPSSLATSFFTGSHVDTSSIDLRAGTVTPVPSAGLYFIDPLDANNKYDPLVGRYVYRRDVTILSKATVNASAGGGAPVSSYIMEKVSVRGAPLLAYAIFYSGNDLEFGESPQMDIYGPVHVNGHLFVGPTGTAALGFHGPVTASGNVFHAWRGTTSVAQEGGNTIGAAAVNFSTDGLGATSATMVNMKTSGGIWNDSTMGADSSTSGLAALQALVTPARSTAFAQYASQTWKGNLQTTSMGIQAYNPMGFSEIVAHDSVTNTDILATDPAADDGSVVGTGAGYGHGYGPHSLIEPSISTPVPSTDPYQVAKQAIEEQKFANKAGLYIKVVVDAANVASITLYGDPRSAPAGTPSANIGPNGGIKLGNYPTNVIQYIPYTTTVVSGNTQVTKGLYDQHQDKGVNLVQINMAALKTALTDMAGTTTTAGTDFVAADNVTKWGVGTTSGYDKYTPSSTGWNGGIYIDVSSASTNHTGVILANGKVSSGGSLMPTGSSSPNATSGLTIATNAPAYILGHFNADGTISTATTTNSALYPDDTASGVTPANSVESPVAIAADAVTVLSPNFFGTGGSGGTNLAPTTAMSSGNAYDSYRNNYSNATGDVEIAAALITGTVTTSPDSSGTQMYSGGVHNLPRFLEHFGSGSSQKTVAIRGSMVSMFNSRIATAGWSQSYYSAPIRQWGYDQLFASGKLPPIIPRVLSYRRVDFTYLANAAAYATEVSRL